MSKKIATDERVFEAADQLVREGKEPSVQNVRAMVGGSFTTIQEALFRWADARAHVNIPLADEVVQAMMVAAQVACTIANRHASTQVEATKVQQSLVLAAAEARAKESLTEIRRLEAENQSCADQLELAQSQLAATSLALDTCRSEAARLPDLLAGLEFARAAEARAYDRTIAASAEAATLAGQCSVLDRENAGLREMVSQLTRRLSPDVPPSEAA